MPCATKYARFSDQVDPIAKPFAIFDLRTLHAKPTHYELG